MAIDCLWELVYDFQYRIDFAVLIAVRGGGKGGIYFLVWSIGLTPRPGSPYHAFVCVSCLLSIGCARMR